MIYLIPQQELPTEEEMNNMDAEDRNQFTINYYNGVYARAGFKPTFIQKMKYRFKTLFKLLIVIIGIVIIYGIVNFLFVGVQNMWHSGDKDEMNDLKNKLDSEIIIINKYEKSINSNQITVREYSDYKNILNLYNNQVSEYNDLAKKVGTTYYVVPVPRGTK